jgi:Domain of unknown function (DUF1707)
MTRPGEQQKAGRTVDDHFRISDADRDGAAAWLRDHFAAGRLTAAEALARDGRGRRPWGAVRVRCQPSRISGEPGWRDALAVVSILLPLIVFITTAVQVAGALPVILDGAPNVVSKMFPLWLLNQFTGPLALLALSLLRLQRIATRTTVALLIGLAYLAILSYLAGGPDPVRVSTIAGGPTSCWHWGSKWPPRPHHRACAAGCNW